MTGARDTSKHVVLFIPCESELFSDQFWCVCVLLEKKNEIIPEGNIMTKLTLDAVNKQIQAEYQAAYLYLAMSVRFEEMKMSGAAKWMRIQWEEEITHALKLFDHLVRIGQSPVLDTITKPEVSFDSALDAFEQVLANEKEVTRQIHGLYEVAVEEKDYALQTLLHWFIDEQVEEEENAEAIIDSIRLAGESGQGLFLVDRELGLRTPEAAEE